MKFEIKLNGNSIHDHLEDAISAGIEDLEIIIECNMDKNKKPYVEGITLRGTQCEIFTERIC